MTTADNARKTNRQLFVIFALLIILFAATMISVFAISIPYKDVLRMVITTIGATFLIVQLGSNLFSKRNILLPLTILFLLIVGTTVTHYLLLPETRTTLRYGTLQVFDSVMWIGVFSWAYYIGNHGVRVIERSKRVAWCIALFFVLFLGVKQFSAGRGIPLISTAYYTLFLLPFALMLKNRVAKWGLTLLSFAAVLLSTKRTGFIAFVAAILVYFIVEFRQSPKTNGKKLKIALGAIIGAVLGYAFFQYYTRSHDLGMIDRLLSVQEDGGSGRTEIWRQTAQMILDSDPLSLIFGHGFNTVYGDSPLALSAHNDILEVIYDYGIFGVVLYLSFCVKVFAYYKKVKREKPELAKAYAVSLVLFVCMSLFAHLVIYTTHFMFLCVFWGLVIGELDKGITIRRKQV